jgi:hypothetical protein
MDGVTPSLNSPSSYSVPTDGWQDTVGSWPKIRTSFLVLISSSKPDYLLACPENGAATYSAWATGLAGPEAVKWAAREWIKQAVNGVYSATNTQIVDASWTDKGQFLHVKVIPMNNLICETTFSGDGSFFGINSTADNAIPSAPRFTTRGATVNVKNGTVSRTVTATSSLLNLVFSGDDWEVSF